MKVEGSFGRLAPILLRPGDSVNHSRSASAWSPPFRLAIGTQV
jgi:hypothetical protein